MRLSTANIVWSDIHHNITKDSLGNIKMAINEEAVRTSIDNILNTSKGERLFRPTFGSGLRNLLFEPMTESVFNSVAKDIKDAIEAWDNRVIIESVSVQADPDKGVLDVLLNFRINGIAQTFTHTTRIV